MVDMLKALAEGNRLRIVRMLSRCSRCVCEIEKELKLPQNLVSHHLAVLKDVGIVEDCRCGKNKYYSLNKKAINKITKELTKLGENKDEN
jgi:ArsR family transcriptional regulator